MNIQKRANFIEKFSVIGEILPEIVWGMGDTFLAAPCFLYDDSVCALYLIIPCSISLSFNWCNSQPWMTEDCSEN